MKKTVLLRTFGCQMNKRDSELLRGMLEEEGYRFVDDEDEKTADIIIFNTCSVREHAAQKAISIMGALSRTKERKHKIYGIIGCVAQHMKETIFKNLPHLDFIAGPSDIYRVPDLIKQAGQRKVFNSSKTISVELTTRPLDYVDPSYRDSQTHAYVNIMYGCDNYCTYCIVPYVRGHEVSRPAADVIKEIEHVVKGGITRVTLLGQNVNSYKSLDGRGGVTPPLHDVDFVGLLKMVDAVPGLKLVSFLTSHPKDASLELFKAMAELPRIDKHLHLPLQSGSDRILKLMNRGYTVDKYLKLVEGFRKAMPNGKISTDFIVGFPTESEDDFLATKAVMEKARFDSAFIFKYSPRPPAKSSEMKDDVPEEEKKRRNIALIALQKKISNEKR